MISFNRRQLVAGIGAAFATGIIGSEARAAMGPNDKFDLVIKGGEVLAPARSCAESWTSAFATAGSKRSRPTFPPRAPIES